MTALEKAILKTFAWFDWQHQPLTSFECWYFLWCEKSEATKTTQQDVYNTLKNLQDGGLLKCDRGFWQLASSPSYVDERFSRARWSITKRRRAERVARLISHLPFVKLVALANTLASGSAKQDSDIDLLIVTRAKRMYITRLLITSLVQFIGWRRHGNKIANRVCLSFYLSEDHLNIKDLSYEHDPYLIYWLANLYPLTDKNVFQTFLQANSWSYDNLPNRYGTQINRTEGGYKPTWSERLLGGRFGDMLEYVSRGFQLFLIRRHKNSRLNDGTSAVVVSNSVLKFHESDRRPQLAEIFINKQKELLDKYPV